jgi:hypothetical protein
MRDSCGIVTECARSGGRLRAGRGWVRRCGRAGGLRPGVPFRNVHPAAGYFRVSSEAVVVSLVQFQDDWVHDGQFAINLQPCGVNEHGVCKVPEPKNAPSQEGRIPAHQAGSNVRLLSLAMFPLRDGAIATGAGQTGEYAWGEHPRPGRQFSTPAPPKSCWLIANLVPRGGFEPPRPFQGCGF